MMALLNLALLQHFSALFIFLLVFVLLYAVLSKAKFFGEGKEGLYAILAFIAAILIATSNFTVRLISFIVPWYSALAIIAFFILLVFGVIGARESDLRSVVRSTTLRGWIIGFSVAILVFGLAFTFGETLRHMGYSNSSQQNVTTSVNQSFNQNPYGSGFGTDIVKTLFHPNILGLMLLFLIAMFTMLFLTKPASK